MCKEMIADRASRVRHRIYSLEAFVTAAAAAAPVGDSEFARLRCAISRSFCLCPDVTLSSQCSLCWRLVAEAGHLLGRIPDLSTLGMGLEFSSVVVPFALTSQSPGVQHLPHLPHMAAAANFVSALARAVMQLPTRKRATSLYDGGDGSC
jgi:hypothetical protein